MSSAEQEEKRRRIYYQNIVYAICVHLDTVLKRPPLVCGTVVSPTTETQDAVLEIIQDLATHRHELATYRRDMEAAAGELLVSIPEPGTDMAKLLSANILLRRSLQSEKELRKEDVGILMQRHAAQMEQLSDSWEEACDPIQNRLEDADIKLQALQEYVEFGIKEVDDDARFCQVKQARPVVQVALKTRKGMLLEIKKILIEGDSQP